MRNTKPLIAAATACDQVILGKDNVPSIIRMVDIYNLEPIRNLKEGEVGSIKLTLFVSLRAGDLRGDQQVDVVLRPPTGPSMQLPQLTFALGNEPNAGANVIVQFDMPVHAFGMHWFDLLWKGELLTSIPLKLVLK